MRREELKKLGKSDLIALALRQQILIKDLQARLPAEPDEAQEDKDKNGIAGEHHSHSRRSHHRHHGRYEKFFDRFTVQHKKNFRIALFILVGVLVTMAITYLIGSGGRF